MKVAPTIKASGNTVVREENVVKVTKNNYVTLKAELPENAAEHAFQWQKKEPGADNFENITNIEMTDTLEIATAGYSSEHNGVQYRCAAKYTGKTLLSETVTIQAHTAYTASAVLQNPINFTPGAALTVTPTITCTKDGQAAEVSNPYWEYLPKDGQNWQSATGIGTVAQEAPYALTIANCPETYDGAQVRFGCTTPDGFKITSDPAVLKKNPKPTLTAAGTTVEAANGKVSVVKGNTVTLTATMPEGAPQHTLKWQIKKPGAANFVDIIGATGTALEITTNEYSSNYNNIPYRCAAVYSGNGEVPSEPLTIGVKSAYTTSTDFNPDITQVSFELGAAVKIQTVYTCQKDGIDFPVTDFWWTVYNKPIENLPASMEIRVDVDNALIIENFQSRYTRLTLGCGVTTPDGFDVFSVQDTLKMSDNGGYTANAWLPAASVSFAPGEDVTITPAYECLKNEQPTGMTNITWQYRTGNGEAWQAVPDTMGTVATDSTYALTLENCPETYRGYQFRFGFTVSGINADIVSNPATLTTGEPLPSADVSGKLVSSNGTPLPGRNVALTVEENGVFAKATTGEDGNFTLSGVPNGSYTLTTMGLSSNVTSAIKVKDGKVAGNTQLKIPAASVPGASTGNITGANGGNHSAEFIPGSGTNVGENAGMQIGGYETTETDVQNGAEATFPGGEVQIPEELTLDEDKIVIMNPFLFKDKTYSVGEIVEIGGKTYLITEGGSESLVLTSLSGEDEGKEYVWKATEKDLKDNNMKRSVRKEENKRIRINGAEYQVGYTLKGPNFVDSYLYVPGTMEAAGGFSFGLLSGSLSAAAFNEGCQPDRPVTTSPTLATVTQAGKTYAMNEVVAADIKLNGYTPGADGYYGNLGINVGETTDSGTVYAAFHSLKDGTYQRGSITFQNGRINLTWSLKENSPFMVFAFTEVNTTIPVRVIEPEKPTPAPEPAEPSGPTAPTVKPAVTPTTSPTTASPKTGVIPDTSAWVVLVLAGFGVGAAVWKRRRDSMEN